MNVKELIKNLQNIKQELQEKEVTVMQPNGLLTPAEIKFQLKEPSKLDKTKDNVECIILS